MDVFEMVLSQGLVEDRIRLRELLGHHPKIIKKAANSRRREDMPHLMLLEHAKQRLDRLGARATDEKATKPECTRFIGRVESQRSGTLHLHTLLWKLPSLDVSTRANASDSSASSALRDYVSGYCMRDPGHRGVTTGAQTTTQEDLA